MSSTQLEKTASQLAAQPAADPAEPKNEEEEGAEPEVKRPSQEKPSSLDKLMSTAEPPPPSGGEKEAKQREGNEVDEMMEEWLPKASAAAVDQEKHSEHSGSSGDRELYLTDPQKDEFTFRLQEEAQIAVPLDPFGKPYFTKSFVRTLPDKKLAQEIMTASYEAEENRSYSESWSSDTEHREEEDEETGPPPETILQIKYTPSGLGYIVDKYGQQRFAFEESVLLLDNAFTEEDLQKLEEANREKDAPLLAQIRQGRRAEEKKKAKQGLEGVLKLHEVALRYIPKVNARPRRIDQIHLLQYPPKHAPIKGSYAPPPKKNDFIHLLDPRDYIMGKVDSFATVASTVERKFSNASVRGSMLSTHLSEFPSMFSQALVDDPSQALLTANQQVLDITPSSAARFRERWLSAYVQGFSPRNTFTVSIINLITRRNVELRVCKEYTLNDICHLYMQYEDHPEYYVWKDIHGRVLNPQKTLIENGMMGPSEKMEYQGYRKLPVILLYFRDGFENDPPTPLNPLYALRTKDARACRNY